jgi:hypothetical protein
MAARKQETTDDLNMDALFPEYPPTIIAAPNCPLVGTFQALRKTQVEIDGRLQDTFVAEINTISGQEINRDTGEVTQITPGEARSWWVFGTVVREELKEARPVKGERMVILDRGMKLKRDAVKRGVTLENLTPAELKENAYHDTHVAFPDRPQPVAEEASFDEL